MRFSFLTLLFCTLLTAQTASAQVMRVEGSLPRDLSTGQFVVTVTISGVPDDKKIAGDADANAAARFEIRVGENQQEILFSPQPGYDAEAQRYYIEVEEETPPEADPTIATQWLYRYTLRFIDNSGSGANLKTDVSSDELNLYVKFFLGGTLVAEKDPATINRDLYVATETPTFEPIAITGIYEGLIVDYVEKESIATTDGQKTATTLNLFVVDTAIVTEDTALPAKLFSGSADTEDSDATCEYIAANIDGGECVACPAGQIYLDAAAIATLPGFRVVAANAANDNHTIRGLENRQTEDGVYVVFGQYEPAGISRSVCVPGLPSKDTTLTELNGAGKAKVLDLRCFITTAAYGSALHRSVDLFRAFRDRVLLKFSLGEWFVETYYELSPPLAKAIETSPTLKAATRVTLLIPAAILDFFYGDQF